MNNIRSIRRILAASLAALLVAGTAGCTSDTPSQNGEPGGESTSSGGEASPPSTDGNFNPTGLPIMNEKITIDALAVISPTYGDGSGSHDNIFFQQLEEETNIHIEFQVAASADWPEQRSIMLASGSLPSVIFGHNVFNDASIINNLDYFLQLDDLIENYMPNLQEVFEMDPEMRRTVTYVDGHIYSMPWKLPCRPVSAFQPMINKTWLDNLGLDMPATTEDLYNVFKAFKEQDANGNGDPDDEIPYSGDAGKNYANVWRFLAPFGVVDAKMENMLTMRDGSPMFEGTMPEYKEGIAYMHRLFSEGLIDPEFFTQDVSMFVAKRHDPEATRIGMAFGWSNVGSFSINADEYEYMTPIKGPEGHQYVDSNPAAINYGRNAFEITTFCEYPEAAARWADLLYTNEASIQNYWGPIGVAIIDNGDGTYTVPEQNEGDTYNWKVSPRDYGPKYVTEEFEKRIIIDPLNGDGMKLIADEVSKDYVLPNFPNVFYTIEETEEMSTMTTDIYAYVQTMGAKWITEGGIDEEWDAYVDQLEKMGLPRLMEIHQTALDRYNAA